MARKQNCRQKANVCILIEFVNDFRYKYNFSCFSDSKIFQSNRKDSKKLLGIIREKDSYELKYQLIKAAFEKLLQVSEIKTFQLTFSN